jgi:hypothetical protein
MRHYLDRISNSLLSDINIYPLTNQIIHVILHITFPNRDYISTSTFNRIPIFGSILIESIIYIHWQSPVIRHHGLLYKCIY